MRKYITRYIQFVKFAIVGVMNTLIDFMVFNLGVFLFDLQAFPASIISTSTALVFSYLANSSFVFKSIRTKRNAVQFILLTLFGLWVLHSGAVYFIDGWLENSGISDENSLIRGNLAKVLATSISLLWNFFVYKHVVFKEYDNDDVKEEN